MKTNKTLLSLAVTCGLVATSSSANAAGFQLAEYSATGLGRAYAGEAAMADNASAQWRNPAMLTHLEGTQISTGAIYVDPNIDINGEVTTNSATGDRRGATSSKDIAHSAVIPNLYLSHKYNDKLAIGFALGTNYGMETELESSFTALHFGDKASVKTVEAVASLGYQVIDNVSVGAGIRYVTGEGHFGASLKSVVDGSVTTLKYMEGDDTSWGYQLGAAWDINEHNRIGVAYKSEVTMDFEGTASGLSYTPSKPGTLSIPLPATLEVASFHQLTDTVSIHASVNWTDWSKFKELQAQFATGPDTIKTENWKDNYRFAVGATYQYNAKLALRTGVAYDTSAVDDKNRTTTIPETDRTWLSLGASYQFTDQFSLDGGFTYILAKDAPIKEPRDASDQTAALTGGNFEGEISGDVWLIGLQANYTF
ncbi:outer membrane protein transport protein [Vibrio europaeus]|uniref:outer membrane protein transport protein n=1 Tax=Vibrio europaeus TaxID=300876 RepID=UPI00233EC291|nr:outer membrane protein transport protein [Vibrio europaeus]MDC5822742.1 outer membrane protein transport protein [Vibrio europaeus]MDC5854336.1 outer membrane protein transport protein [Vibrio europaeus]MDC5869375.1 outer membrane protein transport protein [Vibrio europaeus]